MFICSSYAIPTVSPLLPAVNLTFIRNSMLPPTRINVLGLLLLFPLDIVIIFPYYFSQLSTSTYNFIHFDFPQMRITIHQVCSFQSIFYRDVYTLWTTLLSFSNFHIHFSDFILRSGPGNALPLSEYRYICCIVLFTTLHFPALRLFSLPLFFLSYILVSCFSSHKERSIFCWKWV